MKRNIQTKRNKGIGPCSAFRRLMSIFLCLIMLLGYLPNVSALGAPVSVANTTLEQISGSSYNSNVDVYLAVLPSTSSDITITIPDGSFIKVLSSIGLINVYAPTAVLENKSWYSSSDEAVIYEFFGELGIENTGYDSIEDLLADYCGACESSEQHITDCDGYESAAAFWNDKFHTDSFTDAACTLKINDLMLASQSETAG